MTKTEAWRIIEECKGWNPSQKSLSLVCWDVRTQEDDILDAKRAALAQAWRVVGEQEAEQPRKNALVSA
jgi:hypothetical protein